MVAIIGGEPHRFRPLIDLYREAGKRAGHAPEQLKVGIHALGYVADTDQQASDDFFPGYAEAFTKIGQERGWPPVTRAQFEHLLAALPDQDSLAAYHLAVCVLKAGPGLQVRVLFG